MSAKSDSLSFLGSDHLVMVDCDLPAGRIRIEQPRLSIRPGENVIWSFRGVPQGWKPLVIFELGVEIPFESMTQSPLVAWGLGAKPTAKEVRYRVALQRGGPIHLWNDGGVVAFSAPARLEVKAAAEQRTSESPVVFTVTRNLEETDPQVALVVAPQGQQLRDGQVVEWRFDPSCFPDGDPALWQSIVVFTAFEGESAPPDLTFGPVQMIGTSPGLVAGSGNNGVVGTYRFQVFVLSLEHSEPIFASSPDPSIDNRDGIDG